ncbi:MAG: class I tRNA ligase family protein [Armatimonadetes bacterium]|nr:class I tRNA ligase family protein [Armatimonadota bacterium]
MDSSWARQRSSIQPVLFRATEQWFVNVDANDLRKNALQTIKEVKWYPSWGEERISNMVTDRPDWCISRQRLWGVPIPVFYCETCKEPLFTEETISAVEACFEKEGADAWYLRKAEEILPSGFTCPRCQGTTFRKEMDIFDVWFESGVSNLAVLEKRPELSWPCDLYLEGSDQHRGWFQVSLLAALASRGRAPYREVLTHGWVLDAEGKTMHKSLGNVIDPMEILKDHGADVLRLFIASVDYKGDVRIGDEVLKQTGEVYRKIRNTFRYLLGNLNDFDPRKDRVPQEQMLEIDRWALFRLGQLVDRVTNAYSAFEFHLVFYHLHNFCATDLSSVYLDVIKDRLYTYAPCSPERRSAQTALYKILLDLLVVAFPILSFTAEEIWQNLPVTLQDRISVQLLSWPKPESLLQDAPFEEKWQQLLRLRNDVYGVLEEARQKKLVNQAQEASVDLYLPPETYEKMKQEGDLLQMLFMVSQLNLHSVEGELPSGMSPGKEFSQVRIRVEKAAGVKCPRCWNFFVEQPDIKYGELCPRCSRVMETGFAVGAG